MILNSSSGVFMKVRCKCKILQNPEFIGFIYNNDWNTIPIFYNFDTNYAEYKVIIDVDYEVFGIMVINGKIHYVIDDKENLLPKPYPSELFSVLENKMDGVVTVSSSNNDICSLLFISFLYALIISFIL